MPVCPYARIPVSLYPPQPPAAPRSPPLPPLPPALALLHGDLAPACLVSTMPADPSHAIWTASEPAVCIGWSAPATGETPGLIPWPILVWPVPETGEYVVSYAGMCEMATLVALPEMVRVLTDRSRPAPLVRPTRTPHATGPSVLMSCAPSAALAG